MEYVAHEETKNGVTLKVIQDEDAADPRVDMDNAGVMCCDHGRYNLGDTDGHDKARAAIRASRDYRERWEDPYSHKDGLDFNHGPDLFKALQRCSDIVWLPLYLYDHSGITISTSPFSCPWDSGQVGFTFMDKATVLYEYGGKNLTPTKRERAESLLRAEVETYDTYLRGEVYGYVVHKVENDEFSGESCWGFYGLEYAIEAGQEIMEGMIEERTKDEEDLDKLGVPAVG